MEHIGIRIKNIRKFLKKSQDELAQELGVTKQAISNIENSKNTPSVALLDKLLVKYDVNLNYIISGVGDIFIKHDLTNKALKESLIKEFEEILDMRL